MPMGRRPLVDWPKARTYPWGSSCSLPIAPPVMEPWDKGNPTGTSPSPTASSPPLPSMAKVTPGTMATASSIEL